MKRINKKTKIRILSCLCILMIVIISCFVEESYADYSGACSSASWNPQGSSTARHIINRIYYTRSCSTTSCSVTCQGQGGIYKDNLSATITGTLSMSGAGSTSGSKSYSYSKNGTNHTGTYYNLGGTLSRSVARGTSASSVSCSNYVYKSNGSTSYGYGKNCTSSVSITIPALDAYAVTYNGNGGSGVPSNQSKIYNQTLTLSSTKPTREGYTFNEWNTAADGTGTSYAAGGSYTNNSAVTLYAQWTPNSYTVHYNNNTGSGTMGDSQFTYEVTGTLRQNTFTKTGYKFMGWNKKTDSTSTWYREVTTAKNLTTSTEVTLYAQWCKVSQGTIKINDNEVKDSYGNYVFANERTS